MAVARGRIILWLVSLAIAALVGLLVAVLSDLPPGVVALIAALTTIALIVVGGRIRKRTHSDEPGAPSPDQS